ncbi:ATP-binding protein [Kitasatospora sp. NPDC050467]|uniref:ATP-binding protein n=1 Tax=Kitasatospora sp. NPDC050467 TaxID=3364053 RepID=UPI0037B35849
MPEIADSSPVSAAQTSCWLARSRRSPGEARRLLEKLLADVPDGHRFVDVGLLICSELVTNAVLHGTPSGNRIHLALEINATRLRIEVHDARADREPVLRTSAADDENGRGLMLVKSLADRWGCCPRIGIGKIVWAEIGPDSTAAGCAA